MSKWDKLIKRICNLSKDIRFNELLTVPKDEPIKKVYVELVRHIIESEAENDENA